MPKNTKSVFGKRYVYSKAKRRIGPAKPYTKWAIAQGEEKMIKSISINGRPFKIAFTAALGLALAFTFSCSGGDDPYGGSSKGNDIANYKTVKIGSQVWMAENLNYNVAGSKCYGEGGEVIVIGQDGEKGEYIKDTLTLSDSEVQANCVKYGRLYDWATAMALPSSCNHPPSCVSQIKSKHKGICPNGWHIPNSADWDTLLKYVDGIHGGNGKDESRSAGTLYTSYTAGKYLKAASGWNPSNGTDAHGFAALPGGGGHPDGYFFYGGIMTLWWSTLELSTNDNGSSDAYRRYMGYDAEYAYFGNGDKDRLLSVRCLQD
jgi:uncharacterized protein (TIGR02145 family)